MAALANLVYSFASIFIEANEKAAERYYKAHPEEKGTARPIPGTRRIRKDFSGPAKLDPVRARRDRRERELGRPLTHRELLQLVRGL